MEFLKKFYVHQYQKIVYAISVFKVEVEKVFAFISPILTLSTFLKVFYNVPKSTPVFLFFVITPLGYFLGTYLIKLGVPKKTNDLVNQQNPALIKLLEQQEEILKRLK